MHKEAMEFVESVKAKLPNKFRGADVLEVGSRYINGTVRTLFSDCDYHGIDLGYGPLVDEVVHGADIHGEWDTIISCEALEHDARWQETVQNLLAQLRPGGLLILTAGGTGRAEHGTHAHDPASSPDTLEHYENVTEYGFLNVVFPIEGNFKEYGIEDKDGDFRFWGLKR